MAELILTNEEKEILIEVLEDFVSDIRMEIADTDSHDFKEKLKSRKIVVKKILQSLIEEAN